ncbi:MAG: 4Fe-4S dicluster domain-containing protein [Thermoproteota archaeon]|nr:4Fe-4S dicluster domain-containing protein [Thermoproteota archaeon]
MNELAERVTEISDQNVYSCYQCGCCSAGCMFTDNMDTLPHQVIELIQRGDKMALEKNTSWICASCFVCSIRCPRGLDVAAIMEALREIKIRERGFRKVDLRKIKDVNKLPQIAITAAAQKFTW